MKLCLVISLAPSAATAAVLTTTSVAPPSTSLVQVAANATTGNAQWRNNTSATSGRRDVGQTFQIPDSAEGFSLVSGLTFRISDVASGIGLNADGATFSLSIYSFSSASDFTPDGPALYTSTGTLPGVLSPLDYLTFSLDTPISLTENQYYGVVLTFPTMATNQNLSFVSGSYSNGTGVFYQWSSADSQYTFQAYSGDFQLYVTTVPEPQGIALVAMAGAAFFLVRRRKAPAAIVAAAVFAAVTCAPAQAARDHTILLIGDSTVLSYPAESPIQGWGNYLPNHLQDGWIVVNLAKGGASSKTYVTFPQWQKAQEVKSDYVFIQFGHNDAHGPAKPESTDAATDFRTNLKSYITWARDNGAKPVLVTPMHRRTFAKNGTLKDSLRPYAEAMKAVAAEEQVPVIDLHTASGEWFLSLGEAASANLTGPNNDLSHFSPEGAEWLAARVAQQAREVDATLHAAFVAKTNQP